MATRCLCQSLLGDRQEEVPGPTAPQHPQPRQGQEGGREEGLPPSPDPVGVQQGPFSAAKHTFTKRKLSGHVDESLRGFKMRKCDHILIQCVTAELP